MSGGAITNNTANNNGGGVYVESSGTFTMTRGSIYANTAPSTTGVSLYVGGGGTATINGVPYSGAHDADIIIP